MSKRFIVACLLFTLGTLGVIAMVAAAIMSPLNPWGIQFSSGFYMESWFSVIFGLRALVPFILFGLMSIAGLIQLVYELISERKK